MPRNFETTNWSLVVRATALTTEVRRMALAELCEAYWSPLYSFARRHGYDQDDASDLTQGFFAHLIEKHALDGVTPTKGKFRSFLLASFKNFQSEARRRARARKRGGNLIPVPWDEEALEARYRATIATDDDAEQLFVRQWALTVIDRARRRLRGQYVDAARVHEFDVLSPYLAPKDQERSVAELAGALGTTQGAARVALHRFRRRFGAALRAEIGSTVANPDDVESELRFLLGALERRGVSTA